VTPRGAGPGERALQALEALLEAQRQALTAGDLAGMERAHARIHSLLSDAGWRRDAARGRSQPRLRTALKAAALNAGLAARGEAQTARALAALGVSPSLYTATGAYAGGTHPSRGVAA